MGRNGKPTRDKILKQSKELIYENGFAGTSVDLILQKTGITKGAFFYHFKTKADLALALMKSFEETDIQELERVMSETEKYKEQPKRRLLEYIQCFIDIFSGVVEPPNCLYASVSNEQNQYNEEIKQIVSDVMFKWRTAFAEMIKSVIKTKPPKFDIDIDSLADHFTVVIEGAFIMSKAINDPSVTEKQLKHLKNYFDLLFDD